MVKYNNKYYECPKHPHADVKREWTEERYMRRDGRLTSLDCTEEEFRCDECNCLLVGALTNGKQHRENENG